MVAYRVARTKDEYGKNKYIGEWFIVLNKAIVCNVKHFP